MRIILIKKEKKEEKWLNLSLFLEKSWKHLWLWGSYICLLKRLIKLLILPSFGMVFLLLYWQVLRLVLWSYKPKMLSGITPLKLYLKQSSLYLTAFLIWYVIFWLSKNVSDKKVLEGQALNAMEISSWGIFFVVFFAILREGFETAIFLISSFSITGTFSYIGFIVGAALAILIGYLIVTQGRKIDLRSVFKYTTLLLVFLSAGMIAYGTHEAEEYLVKSEQIDKSEIYRVWDILEPTKSAETGKTIYHPFHDKGSIGLFLKGFFGYNSNPNIPEVILWFLAMLFGLNMWRRFYY